MTVVFVIFIVSVLFSCQKYKVNKAHPELIGDWIHYTGNGYYYAIYINANGRGSVYEYNVENDGLDTQSHVWLVKDNQLKFARRTWLVFDIDQYPVMADSAVVNNFDSIPAGRTFMILDGRYFLKQ